MESILLCLKNSILKQNQFIQRQIYIEILDFLTNCVSHEDRDLLIEQLGQIDVVVTLNEGVTSNLGILLVILKLLCTISENPKFFENFWLILKNIARTLIFLIKSTDFPELQEEFVEVMFMMEILLKRFHHNASKNSISEDDIWTLKSLLVMCESVFKNFLICKPCKLSVVLLFTQILLILKRFEVLSNEKQAVLVHLVLEVFYTTAECCLTELDAEKGYIAIYLVVKMLINLMSFHSFNEYDKDCFLQFLVHLFEKYFWRFLFEDTTDLLFADFLVTIFNEVLWTVWRSSKKTVFQISDGFLQQNGIERLIMFLKETTNILKTKAKLLITIMITAVITNQYMGEDDSLISNTLFQGQVERFANLKRVECTAFNDNTKSFIYIFFVIMKHGNDNCIEHLPMIFQKICTIVEYVQTNRIDITPTEFWSALSIYQVCYNFLEKRNIAVQVDQKLFPKVNEIFKSIFRKEFCLVSVSDSDQLAWLKNCDESLFERCVEIYLKQGPYDICCENNNNLLNLIIPSRILHLVFSNSYNQIINASKILSHTRLSVEDEKYLLYLADTSKILDPTQILALLFIFEQNISLFAETSILLKFCKKLLDSKAYPEYDEELKTSLIRLIAKLTIKNVKLIKVNYWFK